MVIGGYYVTFAKKINNTRDVRMRNENVVVDTWAYGHGHGTGGGGGAKLPPRGVRGQVCVIFLL